MKKKDKDYFLEMCLTWLTWSLVIISAWSVLLILQEYFQSIFNPLTKNGFLQLLSLCKPYSRLIPFTFVVITARIALHKLGSDKAIAEGKALLEYRTCLNQLENLEVHRNIRGEHGAWVNGIPTKDRNPETWSKIDNYLGTLELGNILMNKGVIRENNFMSQFGYRVDNVLNKRDIIDHVAENNIDWSELHELFSKRKSYLKKRI